MTLSRDAVYPSGQIKWLHSAIAQKRPFYINKGAILQNNNGSLLGALMAVLKSKQTVENTSFLSNKKVTVTENV